jgi:hypothetical protein
VGWEKNPFRQAGNRIPNVWCIEVNNLFPVLELLPHLNISVYGPVYVKMFSGMSPFESTIPVTVIGHLCEDI